LGPRPKEPSGQDRGPDPEPIVRTVRIAFLLAGMVVAVMVNAGLNGSGGPTAPAGPVAGTAVTGVAAVAVLAVLGGAWLALRPSRLLVAGKRALDHPDPRLRRPRAARARAIALPRAGHGRGRPGPGVRPPPGLRRPGPGAAPRPPVGAAGLCRDQPAGRVR